jgi:peptidyl-tRNA hydrolase
MTNVLGEDERQELDRLRKMELEVLRTRDKDTDDPPVMYMIVRTDLKMSGPKIAVQVGHGVQMFMQLYALLVSGEYISGGLEVKGEPDLFSRDDVAVLRLTGAWLRTSYTKILLGANDHEFTKVKEENEVHIPVVDLGRTEVAPNTETLIVLPPMHKGDQSPLLKRLRLLEL